MVRIRVKSYPSKPGIDPQRSTYDYWRGT